MAMSFQTVTLVIAMEVLIKRRMSKLESDLHHVKEPAQKVFEKSAKLTRQDDADLAAPPLTE